MSNAQFSMFNEGKRSKDQWVREENGQKLPIRPKAVITGQIGQKRPKRT
jgi:hypothetical protein